MSVLDDVLGTAAHLEAENGRLRAALKPFADFADRSAKQFPDDLIITSGSGMARKQLTLGECRAALAVLSG